MSPALRKLVLTLHLVSSLGWLGAVAGFLALAVVGLTTADDSLMRATYIAMDVTARLVIVPLAFTSLLTGLTESLGTAWGLFRHYWVLTKLLLTVFATLVLLAQMGPISHLADAAMDATFGRTDLLGARMSLVAHASGGLIVLLVIATLGTYKPHGRTPYGLRQREGSATSGTGGTEMPRWFRVSAIIALSFVLLLVVLRTLVGGDHGAGRHLAKWTSSLAAASIETIDEAREPDTSIEQASGIIIVGSSMAH